MMVVMQNIVFFKTKPRNILHKSSSKGGSHVPYDMEIVLLTSTPALLNVRLTAAT